MGAEAWKFCRWHIEPGAAAARAEVFAELAARDLQSRRLAAGVATLMAAEGMVGDGAWNDAWINEIRGVVQASSKAWSELFARPQALEPVTKFSTGVASTLMTKASEVGEIPLTMRSDLDPPNLVQLLLCQGIYLPRYPRGRHTSGTQCRWALAHQRQPKKSLKLQR